MLRVAKPLAVAFQGKGLAVLIERVKTISQRYGLTALKMEYSLEQLSRMLGQYDCQATLPVTAVALARNSAVIQKYQSKGFEFAIHGYLHVDYSQLSLEEQEAHLRRAKQVFLDNGIHVAGFRAPYLRSSQQTLAVLCDNDVTYDSSASVYWDIGDQYVTDSYNRALEFYGAQPAAKYLSLPYLEGPTGVMRIPYCLPDDEALVERLSWNGSGEMNGMWPAMFRQIHERGEVFCLGLHPERTAACSGALIATLQEVQAMGPAVWRACLRDIAAWWRGRAEATVSATDENNGLLKLSVNGPSGATLLLRSIDAKTATRLWFDGYRRASELPCLVQVDGRPFIGVSPDAAPGLIPFLKQQGYVVEQSLKPDLYPLYLDHNSFCREDERPLIAHIEGAGFPLVRLGRWPDGARSAFCVTGDIDALTLWDYGLRLLGR